MRSQRVMCMHVRYTGTAAASSASEWMFRPSQVVDAADVRVYVYAVKARAAGQEHLVDYGSTYDYRGRGFDGNGGASPATGERQAPAERTKRP